MDVIGLKLISGFLFFFIVLFFGCLPFFIFRRCCSSNSQTQNAGHGKIARCLHALASGVLIATCLLNLLPESLENVQNALAMRKRLATKLEAHEKNITGSQITDGSKNDIDNNSNSTDTTDASFYPLAEFLVAVGFLVIYIIDSTIKSVQINKNTQANASTNANSGVNYSRLNNYDDEGEDELFVRKSKLPSLETNDAARMHGKECDSEDIQDGFVRSESIIPHSHSQSPSHEKFALTSIETKDESVSKEQKGSENMRSVALIIALCIHGFFDGIMLGLQTSTSMLYSLLVALSLHKTFVATSLSLTLLKNYSAMTSYCRVIIYVLCFASVAPLGLIASAAFVQSPLFTSHETDDVSLVPGCIQAFAVGTFFYVTFTEATTRHGEALNLKSEMLCHVFLLLGFLFMAFMRMTLTDS